MKGLNCAIDTLCPSSRIGIWLIILIILSACSSSINPKNTSPNSPTPSGLIRVVVTTTILGDIVRQVGGGLIDLTILLPSGIDPHAYEPTPHDLAAVTNAELLIVNGLGLEAFIDRLLQNAGSNTKLITASDGITTHQLGNTPDPHVWFNPNNVVIWTQNIERALTSLDPKNSTAYSANSKAYQAQLVALDSWITQQVAQIPPGNRNLVTDHEDMGYYADQYGFKQSGAVIPSFSSVSQPSAQEIAALEQVIRTNNIHALFIGTTVNPNLAQQVANDTGAQLVTVYTDALTDAGGKAESYLALMRYDTSAIVSALK